MAKKTTKSAPKAQPTGDVMIDYPRGIEIDPTVCVISEETNSRASRDEAQIERIATSYITRRNAGKYHQMQPGIVRAIDGDKYEVLDGGYRLLAAIAATATGESFPFFAVVVNRGDDVEALVESVQANEFRTNPSIFERADIIKRLVDAGKSQVEVAEILGVSEATVSQNLKLAKAPKNLRKMAEANEIENDALIAVINLEDTDDDTKEKILAEAVRHHAKVEELTANAETRRKKALLDKQIADAKEKADALAAKAKEAETKRKELEKAKDEELKAAAKTKDMKELLKVRERTEKIEAEIEDLAKVEKDAAKGKEETKKVIEKAKAAKEAVKAQVAKSKTTQEDVRRVASEQGKAENVQMSRKEFYAALESMSEDEKNPLSDEEKALIGKIEALLDGDIKLPSFRKALRLYVRNADEVARAKKANGGK